MAQVQHRSRTGRLSVPNRVLLTSGRMTVLRAVHVRKDYMSDGDVVHALQDVCAEFAQGEFVALMGPSGCGKSTLLHVLGAMDRPGSGEVWLEDLPLHLQSEEALTEVRRTRVGFVFQFFHLLPTFTVEENVALPLLLGGVIDSADRVDELLSAVGLTHKRRAMPNRLSGGEMQRAAIARALAHHPSLVVADEPTGNLDSDAGAQVLDLLRRVAGDRGATVIMATHSEQAAAKADRVLVMRDGRLV